MKMPKPSEGGNFTPVPEGLHLACCYQVVDLGTQIVEYQGERKEQHKVLISWELPEERVVIEGQSKPAIIHNRYTFSSHEKALLRQHLESWRGKSFTDDELDPDNPNGFDIRNLLSKYCQINVVRKENNGKTYSNIKGIVPKPKGLEAGAPENPVVYFAMEDGQPFDRETFNSLPEWTQEIIRKSPEYASLSNGMQPTGQVNDFHDDEIPF